MLVTTIRILAIAALLASSAPASPIHPIIYSMRRSSSTKSPLGPAPKACSLVGSTPPFSPGPSSGLTNKTADAFLELFEILGKVPSNFSVPPTPGDKYVYKRNGDIAKIYERAQNLRSKIEKSLSIATNATANSVKLPQHALSELHIIDKALGSSPPYSPVPKSEVEKIAEEINSTLDISSINLAISTLAGAGVPLDNISASAQNMLRYFDQDASNYREEIKIYNESKISNRSSYIKEYEEKWAALNATVKLSKSTLESLLDKKFLVPVSYLELITGNFITLQSSWLDAAHYPLKDWPEVASNPTLLHVKVYFSEQRLNNTEVMVDTLAYNMCKYLYHDQ